MDIAMDVHQDNLVHINDFELHDFIENPNFDQFISLIRGENDLINDCLVDNQFLSSCPGNPIFDQSQTNNNVVNYAYDPSSALSNSFSSFHGKLMGEREEENDGVDSSATTTTTTTTTETANAKPRVKSDRSKTLISERRRRGRMKEKLYALRSLVPYITKVRVF